MNSVGPKAERSQRLGTRQAVGPPHGAIESSRVLESVSVKRTGALLVLQSRGGRGRRFDPITCRRAAPATTRTFRVHLCGLRCYVQYPSRCQTARSRRRKARRVRDGDTDNRRGWPASIAEWRASSTSYLDPSDSASAILILLRKGPIARHFSTASTKEAAPF